MVAEESVITSKYFENISVARQLKTKDIKSLASNFKIVGES